MVAVALALFLGACEMDTLTVYVDPPVNVGDYTGDYVVEGVPTVILGFYEEQLFRHTLDGDGCLVMWGLQGGTWTMPALRTRGIGSPAVIACDMWTEAGEHISTVESTTNLFLTPDQYLEVQAYPIPVNHEIPLESGKIDALYGQMADLTCTVTDKEGRSGTVNVYVEILEG